MANVFIMADSCMLCYETGPTLHQREDDQKPTNFRAYTSLNVVIVAVENGIWISFAVNHRFGQHQPEFLAAAGALVSFLHRNCEKQVSCHTKNESLKASVMRSK